MSEPVTEPDDDMDLTADELAARKWYAQARQPLAPPAHVDHVILAAAAQQAVRHAGLPAGRPPRRLARYFPMVGLALSAGLAAIFVYVQTPQPVPRSMTREVDAPRASAAPAVTVERVSRDVVDGVAEQMAAAAPTTNESSGNLAAKPARAAVPQHRADAALPRDEILRDELREARLPTPAPRAPAADIARRQQAADLRKEATSDSAQTPTPGTALTRNKSERMRALSDKSDGLAQAPAAVAVAAREQGADQAAAAATMSEKSAPPSTTSAQPDATLDAELAQLRHLLRTHDITLPEAVAAFRRRHPDVDLFELIPQLRPQLQPAAAPH